jgi:hypothetical protein
VALSVVRIPTTYFERCLATTFTLHFHLLWLSSPTNPTMFVFALVIDTDAVWYGFGFGIFSACRQIHMGLDLVLRGDRLSYIEFFSSSRHCAMALQHYNDGFYPQLIAKKSYADIC